MTVLDRAQLEIKLGDYGTLPATAVSNPLLLQRAQAHRRSLSSRMMALDKAGIAKKIPAGDYCVSRKIDGEFTVLVLEGDTCFTINPGGTVRWGLPFMKEAAALLLAAGHSRAIIAGELYVKSNEKGRRPRVHDVVKVARRPETQEELQRLCFAAFDIIEVEGVTCANTKDTWECIEALFAKGKLVHPVPTVSAKTPAEIEKLFETWVEKEGEEGLVVRSDEAGWFKIKPRHTLDVAVVGFTEGTEDRTGMIHDLLVAVSRLDGTLQLLGHVGGGFSEEQRRQLLCDLHDSVVASEYSEVNSDRVAYHMVEPKMVIEISCLDLISQTTRGGTIDRALLNYNAQERRYQVVRPMPLASIISPQFVRIRDDKRVNAHDIRIQQVTDIVEVPLADKSVADLVLPRSEVLRRKVATKTLKGATLVRKIVLWKTNKQEASADYPAYVLHLTDFSPNRADALQREIKVSNSLEQIEAFWAQMETENFVRGWNVVA